MIIIIAIIAHHHDHFLHQYHHQSPLWPPPDHHQFTMIMMIVTLLQDCTGWRPGTWELFASSGFEIPGATKMNGKVFHQFNFVFNINVAIIHVTYITWFSFLFQELGVMEIQSGNLWIMTQRRRWDCTICMFKLTPTYWNVHFGFQVWRRVLDGVLPWLLSWIWGITLPCNFDSIDISWRYSS